MNQGLQLKSVSLSRGGNRLLRDVTLTVQPGEMIALIGRNGAGKSTLLRSLLGLAQPDEGSATVDGRPLEALSGPERATSFGWLPQIWKLEEPVTLLEFVCSARYRFNESRASALAASRQAITDLSLTPLLERSMTTLSGGEAQRATLAALVAQDASFWLLDEPANHLDPAQQFAVYEFIGRQWRSGRGIICVTHDIGLLSHIATDNDSPEFRVVGMKEGGIAFDHRYLDSSLPGAIASLFDVEVRTLDERGRPRFVASMGSGGVAS